MKAKMLTIGALALALTPAAAAASGGKATTTTSQTSGPVAKGQPSQDCGALIEANMGSTPGNSVNSPGSAFNPAGVSGTKYAGQQTQNTVNSATSSQYDVACLHGTR